MVDRNIEGIKLEKAGMSEKAAELYEQNILDGFNGSHPYERLRILYSFNHRYDDAIRVCQSYIDQGQGGDRDLKEKYVKWIGMYSQKRAAK